MDSALSKVASFETARLIAKAKHKMVVVVVLLVANVTTIITNIGDIITTRSINSHIELFIVLWPGSFRPQS